MEPSRRHLSRACTLAGAALVLIVLCGEPALAQADSAAAEATSWMDDVDAFFGKLIGYLAAVFFFDFGTSRWLGTSVPVVVIWLFGGALFFTFRMAFINVRAFKHAIDVTRGKYDNPDDAGEVTHFQALASALSATVGLGNIAGVAIAVGTGGPGAIFWMIVAAVFGMTSKFTECTLGQRYRKVFPDGRVSGGPMRYLSDGLAELNLGPLGKFLGVFFAIMCIGGSLGGGNAFQVSQSMGAISEQLPFLEQDQMPWIYGLVMVVLVGIVIIGGIKRIAATAEKIVPLMCLIYVLSAIYILVANYSHIPMAFGEIVSRAFTPRAGLGGMLGVMVTGIRRAAFSNEAGIGSAAIAHSSARTEEPVREGIVALMGPFIDTIIVCTMTGLVIVITGFYKVPDERGWEIDLGGATQGQFTLRWDDQESEAIDVGADPAAIQSELRAFAGLETVIVTKMNKGYRVTFESNVADVDRMKVLAATPDGPEMKVSRATRIQAFDGNGPVDEKEEELITMMDTDDGARLTSRAFGETITWFPYLLAVAVTLFAYSTMISWSYYGERCWTYLFGPRSSLSYKILFLVFVFLGSIVTARNVLEFGDLMILGMAFPNILGVVLLTGIVRRDLDEYWRKYKAGEFPTFK